MAEIIRAGRCQDHPKTLRRPGNRQHTADRFDPVDVSMFVDEVHHHFGRRSNSPAGTWGEAGFRAGVMDMVGVRIQVVFEGWVRGSGEALLCGSNGRFIRDVPCQPGDGIALISERRTMQVRLPR